MPPALRLTAEPSPRSWGWAWGGHPDARLVSSPFSAFLQFLLFDSGQGPGAHSPGLWGPDPCTFTSWLCDSREAALLL